MSCGVDQLGENCASDYLKTLNCKLRQKVGKCLLGASDREG